MVFVELHDGPLDAVVRQIRKLDRRYDIPYLAGYSRNGKTIYIDRHMPKWFTFGPQDQYRSLPHFA